MSASNGLRDRIRETACRRGTFHLPTGQVINEYFDEFLLAADPALLRDVAEEMAGLIPPDTEALVGVELGGVPLAVALSAASGVPVAFMRKAQKSYGTLRRVEGEPVYGKRVVIVDDVIRSGSQVLQAADVLRELGAQVTTAMCVVDRGLDGGARLAGERIALQALLESVDLETARM
ncbi:orotate phosphoribosyltransferase [Streptomyces sp. NPDC059786]|uniref:orotate phosphoribosyltransferase n=1 Tax=Streptomyces sp. NPDC059786 TaxID=3346946 RepID=UPI003660D458